MGVSAAGKDEGEEGEEELVGLEEPVGDKDLDMVCSFQSKSCFGSSVADYNHRGKPKRTALNESNAR
jgi:hypothetical protein